MKNKKIIFHVYILAILVCLVASCQNTNQVNGGKCLGKNQIFIKNTTAKDTVSKKDTTSSNVIDTTTPPKDINKQEVLLNKIVKNTHIEIFFNKESGQEYLLFEDRHYKYFFSLGPFIGALNIPEPTYENKIEELNDSIIIAKLIFGRTEMGFLIDELMVYEFNVKDSSLICCFDIPDLGCYVEDSLSYSLYNKAGNRDLVQYDYHIDYKKRKVTVHEYDPFKPLSDKYKQLVKKYHINYQAKTIVDSW